MSDEVVAPVPAVIEQNNSGVVWVLAETLARHSLNGAYCLGCDWQMPGMLSSWEDQHSLHVASVVAALPNIAIVPDDAIIPGLGAELRGCIDEYLGGWASTDDAVQPLVGSYFAEGLSDLLSDQIGPIIAAARAARTTGGQG
jgi:hypothetical protein